MYTVIDLISVSNTKHDKINFILLLCLGAFLSFFMGACTHKVSDPVGPNGPTTTNAKALGMLRDIEAEGFASFDNKRWSASDRHAIELTWSIFVTESKFAPVTFVPRYRVDHGSSLIVVMTWVFLGPDGDPLTTPAGASTFTVKFSNDLQNMQILPGA